MLLPKHVTICTRVQTTIASKTTDIILQKQIIVGKFTRVQSESGQM